MNKLTKSMLATAILATSGFASESTIDHATTIVGDMTLTSDLTIKNRTDSTTKAPYVRVFGNVNLDKDVGSVTIKSEFTGEGSTYMYCGYSLQPMKDENGIEQYVEVAGSIEKGIIADDHVVLQPLSVMRSFAAQMISGSLGPYSGETKRILQLPESGAFLISPNLEDQVVMAYMLNDVFKLESESDNAKFTIVMQGAKDTDLDLWKETSRLDSDPFRDLKLSLMKEVKGDATLMGECVLTANENNLVIPTSFRSKKEIDSFTDLSEGDEPKETSITLDTKGNKITFDGELDFSYSGVALKGSNGVIICNKGIKL